MSLSVSGVATFFSIGKPHHSVLVEFYYTPTSDDYSLTKLPDLSLTPIGVDVSIFMH